MAETELLPCPFCGGTPYVADDYGASFSVKCNNPMCGGAVRLWGTREKAIAAWNRRFLSTGEGGRHEEKFARFKDGFEMGMKHCVELITKDWKRIEQEHAEPPSSSHTDGE